VDAQRRQRASGDSGERLFRALFVADDPQARKRTAEGYDVNDSILTWSVTRRQR
jgi:hypothetical protein